MKCRKCGQPAVVALKRHNTAFCREHYLEFFYGQVERAVKEYRMFGREDRILVAVSGGKDSLALWDVLLATGYRADGLYIDLGITGYSDRSKEKVVDFARVRGASLRVISVREQYGLGIRELARQARRAACSVCGLHKRYFFNREALEGGYNVVATGHNLDDEAATLLGNLLNWSTGYLARQAPLLEATAPNLVRKVKPLYRLTEKEIASYAVLRRIDYIVEECPMAAGARSILYKNLLNRLEEVSPGTKARFLFGFLEKGRQAFAAGDEEVQLKACALCGQPTTADVCSRCRTLRRAGVKL
ncbi:MAG: ATP-binding protein [Desulfotomaculales bacterium]